MTSTALAAPLRVAVIGAGYFAQFHHDAWRRIDRAELVAVADTDVAKAEASGAAAFDDPATPYLSCPRPEAAPRFSDYGHLARVKEWASQLGAPQDGDHQGGGRP